MNPALDGRPLEPAGIGRQLRSLEALAWRYPEWWTVALSAAAWTVLAAGTALGSGEHAPHDGTPSFTLSAWLVAMFDWLLMVVAMMLPLVLFPVRLTAVRSLWGRRDRAITGLLIGYLGPWLIVGMGVAALRVVLGLERWVHVLPWLGSFGFTIAAVWQLTPVKQRALRSCHRTIPLAPHGWQADRDCVRFGWLVGGQCVLTCWPLMVACVLASHNLLGMVCAGAIGLAERYVVRPRPGATCSRLLGLALVYTMLSQFVGGQAA